MALKREDTNASMCVANRCECVRKYMINSVPTILFSADMLFKIVKPGETRREQTKLFFILFAFERSKKSEHETMYVLAENSNDNVYDCWKSFSIFNTHQSQWNEIKEDQNEKSDKGRKGRSSNRIRNEIITFPFLFPPALYRPETSTQSKCESVYNHNYVK